MKIPEFFCHGGLILRDGVLGGTSGTIYRRWQMGADYDDDIAQGMNYRLCIQIKRVKKICNNNTETNKGQDGYNKSYRFD